MLRLAIIFILFFSVSSVNMPASGSAADGAAIVTDKCAGCHSLKGAPPDSFEDLLKRRAPDLHYAGSKFKRSWLVKWLQDPTPIRPSGTMFLNHVAVKNGKDRLKPDTLKPHRPKLNANEAEAVAEYLMTLTDPRMKVGVVNPLQKFKRVRALKLFRKQLPCVSCHKIKSGKRIMGGVSAPVLISAGSRLNPDWIYARIENPQYWDPKTWMPRLEMSHKKRTLLTLYIASMK